MTAAFCTRGRLNKTLSCDYRHRSSLVLRWRIIVLEVILGNMLSLQENKCKTIAKSQGSLHFVVVESNFVLKYCDRGLRITEARLI